MAGDKSQDVSICTVCFNSGIAGDIYAGFGVVYCVFLDGIGAGGLC